MNELTVNFTPPPDLSAAYEIIECLSSGGQSETFLVKSRKSGGYLLMKVYGKSVVRGDEYAILARLNLPAIPKAKETFETEDTVCLVREFVDGKSLDKLNLPLDEQRVLDIAAQLCDILGYLHNQTPPIIHRDLKPQNVIIDPAGKIHLIDFGIARQFNQNAQKDTTLILTEGYAPPEQYGFQQTDCRSDIYSLGVLLCFLMTGVCNLSELVHIENRHIARVIQKCTMFSPDDRYPTVNAVKTRLSSMCNIGGARIRLMARDIEDETSTLYPYQSTPLEISGDGTYTLELDVPARNSLTNLLIQTDGGTFEWPNNFAGIEKPPADFSDAQITIDSIIVNDSISVGNIRGTTSLIYKNASFYGYICINLWEAWFKPHQLLSGNIYCVSNSKNNGTNFAVNGVSVIKTVKVAFTISGLENKSNTDLLESIPVRLMARDFDGFSSSLVPYRSPVVNITEYGIYSVTLPIPSRANLAELALMTDGAEFKPLDSTGTFFEKAHKKWFEARLRFDSVEINGTLVGSTFDDFLVSRSDDFKGYVAAFLWGWHKNGGLLTGVSALESAGGNTSFAPCNDENINSVTVKFSVMKS